VLLTRLPEELWERLRAVRFNDQAIGCRTLGYVHRARREIAICAIPARVSLTRFLSHPKSTMRSGRGKPREFGADRGRPWPELAVRRFMLYDVFLHELGHLQIVRPKARRVRRRFASETLAQQFADFWRRRLWSTPLDHADPVHHRPHEVELAALQAAEE